MKKLEKNWKVIMGLLFIMVVLVHLLFHERMGDDIFFSNISLNELFSWLVFRSRRSALRLASKSCAIPPVSSLGGRAASSS